MTDADNDITNDPHLMDEIAYLRRTLRPLDRPHEPLPPPSRQDHETVARFVTEQKRAERHRTSRRRVMTWVGGAIIAGAAAVAAVALDLPRARAAYAATPRVLVITATGGPVRGGSLEQLAAIAERAGPQHAGVDHLVTDRWSLNSTIDDRTVTSAIIATRRQLWRTGDDQARTLEQFLAPEFPSPADRDAWRADGSPEGTGTTRQDYPTGTYPTIFTGRPPRQPDALAGWLRHGDTTDVAVIQGTIDLLNERALTGQERGAVLRALARHSSLAYAGTTTDRAGRPGHAFTSTSHSSGAQIEHLFVIEPTTAKFLAYEQILTAGASALRVHLPAVISYRTYRTAEFVTAIP